MKKASGARHDRPQQTPLVASLALPLLRLVELRAFCDVYGLRGDQGVEL